MTHIIDVRMHGEADSSPLQMISAARLAYLERMEAMAKELVAVMGRGREAIAGISLGEPHEVRYWTDALGVNEDELRRVVADVGNSVDAVRARLNREADPSLS